jgi:lysophospholipase L1-like esterase
MFDRKLFVDRRSLLQNLGLIGATAGTTYWLARPKPVRPRGIYVQMGTSITAGLHAPGAYMTPVVVGSRLNLVPMNIGFDGACAGIYGNSNNPVSLCSLVDAIISGNWSSQERSMTHEPDSLIVARAKSIDFTTVTHLGLEYGTNDFTLCAPLGKLDNDVTTFKGSLNYSIQKFLSAFPELRLFLMTPAWRLNFEELDSDLHPNEKGIFLREYVDAILEVASFNRVPCLDLWRKLSTNLRNFRTFTGDGTHPNGAGAIRRGEMIAAFIGATF